MKKENEAPAENKALAPDVQKEAPAAKKPAARKPAAKKPAAKKNAAPKAAAKKPAAPKPAAKAPAAPKSTAKKTPVKKAAAVGDAAAETAKQAETRSKPTPKKAAAPKAAKKTTTAKRTTAARTARKPAASPAEKSAAANAAEKQAIAEMTLAEPEQPRENREAVQPPVFAAKTEKAPAAEKTTAESKGKPAPVKKTAPQAKPAKKESAPIEAPSLTEMKHQRYYKDLCFMTIPLLCMAYYYYGLRPVLMCAVALVAGNLCDRVVARLRHREYLAADYSNESFAMLIALMLPATVSWYVLIVAVLAGVLIGKEAFGGYGCYPFHPSAVGYVVAAVSWPTQVFRYPQPFTRIPLRDASGVAVQNGISNTLKNGGVPGVDLMDQMLGNYAGPVGTTAALVVLACALFLLVRHDINLYTPLSFLAVVAAIAFIFPRQGGLEEAGIMATIPARLNIMRYELMSGAMLFGAVFLMCEPFTSPRHHRSGKILYGVLLGLTAMAFRYFGAYDTGLCFALLAVNSISEWLDMLVERLHTLTHAGLVRKGGTADEN